MGKPNFSDEFKRDAVAQIIKRGYPGSHPVKAGRLEKPLVRCGLN